jgi:excisionase family DNA binding protein
MRSMTFKLLTTADVAKRLGITEPSRIRQLAISGELKGTKIGPNWVFEEADVARFEKNRPPVGRPPTKKGKKRSES